VFANIEHIFLTTDKSVTHGPRRNFLCTILAAIFIPFAMEGKCSSSGSLTEKARHTHHFFIQQLHIRVQIVSHSRFNFNLLKRSYKRVEEVL
jgi:hypothetical protein